MRDRGKKALKKLNLLCLKGLENIKTDILDQLEIYRQSIEYNLQSNTGETFQKIKKNIKVLGVGNEISNIYDLDHLTEKKTEAYQVELRLNASIFVSRLVDNCKDKKLIAQFTMSDILEESQIAFGIKDLLLQGEVKQALKEIIVEEEKEGMTYNEE